MRAAKLVTELRMRSKGALDDRLDGIGRNKVCCEGGKCRICDAGLGVAPNQTLFRSGLGYLAAVAAPDADREALVSKLSVVMGSAEARKTVASLEALVERRASSGASKVVVKALWGFAIVNVVFMLWRRR